MKKITKIQTDKLAFKDKDGNWLELEDWPHKEVILVCTTDGCSAKGIEHRQQVAVNPDGIIRSTCGPCKQPTTAYDVES